VTATGGRTPEEIVPNCTFRCRAWRFSSSALHDLWVEYPPSVASAQEQRPGLRQSTLFGGIRRQYNLFLGQERGGNAERFIEKAIRKGHVPAHESANRAVIDHIGAKPFFEAIGEQNNRNRR
jgi:hypothetical protein